MELGVANEAGDPGTIRSLSEELNRAIAADDRPEVEKHLGKEVIFIDAEGRVHDRAGALAALRANPVGAGASSTVLSYGTLGQITWKNPVAGGERIGLEVWVKVGETWQARVIHLNTIAASASEKAHPPMTKLAPGAPFPTCRNPLEFIPYAPKSPDEEGIIESFQALETAVVRNEPDAWVKYVADEFIVYRTGQHPTTKAGRTAALTRQREVNAETYVAEAEDMQLWVLGDAAIMRADHVMPGNRRPPYRATRLWVKRDGRWQMALSQQTTRAA